MTSIKITPAHHEVAKRTGVIPPIVARIEHGDAVHVPAEKVAEVKAAIAAVAAEAAAAPSAAAEMPRKARVFRAFDVERRSEANYHFASKDEHGRVRFHASMAAARRSAGRYGNVADVFEV